jgi:hypothetical protein
MGLASLFLPQSYHVPADLDSPLIRILLCAVPAGCALWTFLSWRRLSHIPGPFWWSLSPFPLLRANLVGKSHQILSDLSSTYGMYNYNYQTTTT